MKTLISHVRLGLLSSALCIGSIAFITTDAQAQRDPGGCRMFINGVEIDWVPEPGCEGSEGTLPGGRDITRPTGPPSAGGGGGSCWSAERGIHICEPTPKGKKKSR